LGPRRRQVKVRKLVTVLSVTLLLLAACTPAANQSSAAQGGKKITIGMANLSLCCAYFIGMSKAVQDEAKAYPNITIIETNADGKVEKLTSDVEDLISKKVDGIILSGAFIEAAPAALDAIKKAGIPVVMVDRKLKGGDYTSWIGPDNFAIGQEVGGYLVERLSGKGKLAVIRGGPADNTIGSERTRGVHDKVNASGIEVITYADFAGWSTDGGKKAMEDLLAKNPQLDAVFCENDSMCLGAQTAIADAGRTKEILVAGVDGQKEALLQILNKTNYVATGLNNSNQIGRAGFNRLTAILAGLEASKDTVLPSPLISPANVVKFYDPDSIF
jgi:ribose transport system substrate-binding protein